MEFHLVKQHFGAALAGIDGRVGSEVAVEIQFGGALVMAEVLLDANRPATWLRSDERQTVLKALKQFYQREARKLLDARQQATAGCEVPR